MSQRMMFAWRHGAHVLVGVVLAWLVARGLHVPQPLADWADTLIFAAGVAAYGYVQHWLETRTGDGPVAKAAHWLARFLVLGAPATPTYARRPGRPPRLTSAGPLPSHRRVPPDAVPPRV